MNKDATPRLPMLDDDGSNYQIWLSDIEDLLLGQGVLHTINKNFKLPKDRLSEHEKDIKALKAAGHALTLIRSSVGKPMKIIMGNKKYTPYKLMELIKEQFHSDTNKLASAKAYTRYHNLNCRKFAKFEE